MVEAELSKNFSYSAKSLFKRRPLLYNPALILPANTQLESNSWPYPCKKLLYCIDRYEGSPRAVLLLISDFQPIQKGDGGETEGSKAEL